MLSLPDRGSAVETVVAELWDDLQIVDDRRDLAFLKKKPKIAEKLAPVRRRRGARGDPRGQEREAGGERPVKQVELDALLAAPEGFGDDVPVDPELPRAPAARSGLAPLRALATASRRSSSSTACARCWRSSASRASRPSTPDINGEYETDVERAQIALEPQWFPAVENRGEGVFVQLRADGGASAGSRGRPSSSGSTTSRAGTSAG